ncbi:MAG: lipid IV(A) 3-deoxy-D-manno-octulosonic acid transferase [Gammaproteobacteria bacterium]|nr:lipid IV(A) 3-deoxy-D-manno-octulosonic acid transferase [Gammaproteobacteria bacterium]
MVRLIYTLIYYLLSPLMCVRWFYKSLRPPQYREPFRQRFGFVAKHESTDIWIHAVSMGETSGAISIINKLLASAPNKKIVVTTTTPTGAQLLDEQLGNKVTHYYSPCDLPGTIRRFIKRVQPKLVVIMETELWPNWLNLLHDKKIPTILANARLSKSSARKYATFPHASKEIFSKLSQVLAVNEADAKRFQDIGVEAERVKVTGNIKFDAEFPVLDSTDYFPYWHEDFIWVAASSHQGENEVILAAHQALLKSVPNAKLILVPRHPERFEAVAELIQKQGFSLNRRSQTESYSTESQVLLGDSMGELLMAYQKATAAFIGGSFVDVGGHNPIEAAFYAKPILTGPIYHNFQYLFDALIEQQAAQKVEDSSELAKQLELIATDKQKAEQLGRNAKMFVDANRGALDKVVAYIQSYD